MTGTPGAALRPPPTTIDVAAAEQQLDALLDEVERGHEFIITRDGKAVAQLIPPPPSAMPPGGGEAP